MIAISRSTCSITKARRNRLLTGVLAGILVAGYVSSSGTAAEQSIPGRVAAVTVYRDQARVIREVKIPASDQPQRIRVTGLPPELIEQSSFTQSNEGTHVLSLQVTLPEPDVETADEKQNETLEKLRATERAAEHDLAVIEQDMLTLEQLVKFSADKVNQNLDRATLDVQSVTALADFTMERRRKLAQERYAKQTEIESIKRQISEHAARETRPREERHYEALMTVQSPEGGTVRLAYDVGAVGWDPRYKIDGTQAGKPEFAIQMEAVIFQHSGESWENVALTLATSTPQTQAAGPSLAPLRISTAPMNTSDNQMTSVVSQFGNVEQSEWLNNELASWNLDLNIQAGRRQIEELTSTAEIQRKVAVDAAATVSDETYPIDGNVTLESHAQPQTVTILRTTIQGELYHVVTPLLSSFGFREATLVNESGKSLIEGSADVYLENKFVGRVQVPPTAAGQKLTIGFGNDRQVRTRRELLSRDEVIKGGNRRSELVYRLVISNYHTQPVAIRLLDRIPITAQDDSINLTLSAHETNRLSDDPLYLRMQRPTGILRWDIDVPGDSFGDKAYDHEFGYSIEHDREQTLVSDDLAEKTQEDLHFDSTNMGGGMGGGGVF